MAGDTSLSRIVYRKDERGVILDSAVVIGDAEVPEGFEESAEYESQVWTAEEATPVDESKSTLTAEGPDLRQTVDVILGDQQEGPSDPGGLTGDERNAVEAQARAEAEAADDEAAAVNEGTPVQARLEAGEEPTETEQEALEAATATATADMTAQADVAAEAPPKGGPGSGKEAWAAYAAANGVEVPEDASRDDIIAACEEAGVPTD